MLTSTISVRAYIYRSQYENPRLWSNKINEFRPQIADPSFNASLIQSFVGAIFTDPFADVDRKRIADYLFKKGPEKLRRLFDKIQQGKMLDADTKLSHVSKELKQVKSELKQTQGKLAQVTGFVGLQARWHIEIEQPLFHATLGNFPVSLDKEGFADHEMVNPRCARVLSAIKHHEQIVDQRIKLREDFRTLLGNLSIDLACGNTTVQIQNVAIRDLLDRLTATEQAYQQSAKEAREAGASLVSQLPAAEQ